RPIQPDLAAATGPAAAADPPAAPRSTSKQEKSKRRQSRKTEREGTAKPKPSLRDSRKMPKEPLPPSKPATGSSTAAPDGPNLRIYEINLEPGPEVLRRGINPLGVLDELRELGDTTIATDPSLVPDLESLDPERCYLAWTITVKTSAEPERLDEAFLFFAE